VLQEEKCRLCINREIAILASFGRAKTMLSQKEITDLQFCSILLAVGGRNTRQQRRCGDILRVIMTHDIYTKDSLELLRYISLILPDTIKNWYRLNKSATL
jgi:hypothetical protein